MKCVTLILPAVLLGAACSFQGAAFGMSAGPKPAASRGQKQTYEEQVQAKLRKLDGEIAELNAQLPRQKREIRKQFNQEMGELNQKRAAAQSEMEKFQDTSQQAWRDAKPELDAAVKDLESAYQRAASDFKQKGNPQ